MLLLAALAVTLFLHRPGNIIRTQGIVIVDAQGHDRLLNGAPVPASTDRTRKDDHPDGIILLGSSGADRLAVGQLPSPVIGGKSLKRIGDGDQGITSAPRQNATRPLTCRAASFGCGQYHAAWAFTSSLTTRS